MTKQSLPVNEVDDNILSSNTVPANSTPNTTIPTITESLTPQRDVINKTVRDEVSRGDRPISKRRRKTSSCDACRKLKTRCDFEPITGKCHRCNVLKINCSLTLERREEISKSIINAERVTLEEESDKIGRIEGQLNLVLQKLDRICGDKDGVLPTGEINKDYKTLEKLSSTKQNYLDNSIINSPLTVFNSIDQRLFKRVDSYDLFRNLCQREFLDGFYKLRKEFCLKLGSNFLTTAHFWIIPGGIQRVTEEYVESHPFISAVFVLIAMSFDENYQYAEEQEQLYYIVRKILGIALITSPLTDHDVEAILYCSIYNFARKPHQPLLNSWNISVDGIKSLMLSTSFHNIKMRVENEREFQDDDLFHLRIWTLLNISHLISSIGSGRPHLIPNDYYDDEISELVLEFPQMTIGDNINYAQLKLVKLIHAMFYTNDLFKKVIKYNEMEEVEETFNVTVFKFTEIHNWKKDWKELIDVDTSGTLLFNFEFYHVILSRRFISSYLKIDKNGVKPRELELIDKYLNIGYNTSIYYSICILERTVKLPSSLIRGSPTNFWNQVVYSCLTLYEFNDKITGPFNAKSCLNLISKIYWQLNKIGETKNDATDTVGQIIKSLIDINNYQVSENESNGRITSKEEEINYLPLHDEISHEFSSDLNFNNIISKFETFEDFFNDLNKMN